MATYQERFNNAYEVAHAANPGLTKAQFMYKTQGRRWSNDKSATRAFNKISSGENENPESFIEEEEKVGMAGQRVRPSKRLIGLWKINVAFQDLDQNGEPVIQIRSFIAESQMYQSVLDIPFLEVMLAEEIKAHSEEWRVPGHRVTGNGEYDEVHGDPVDYYKDKHGNIHAGVEVFPINQSQVSSERRVDIDSLVLEGY
jgi:hypothetical protein